MRKMKTIVFIGTIGFAGFLLLLLLLDVGVNQDPAVSEKRDGEPALEMSVMLMPIEATEPELVPEPEVVEREPIRAEKILTEPEEPAQKQPPPIEKTVAEPQPGETESAADDSETSGRFPALVASYTGAGGLRAHLLVLRALGARTFVANMDAQQLVAEVNPASWSLSTDFAPLQNMALDRSRLIDDDRNVEAVIRRAQSLYGYGNFVFVLLMPRAVENRITRGLNHAFRRIGRPASEFVSVHGSYAHNGERLDRKSTRLNSSH